MCHRVQRIMNFSFDDNNSTKELFESIDLKINILVQQRNGRKSWTLIEGLENII